MWKTISTLLIMVIWIVAAGHVARAGDPPAGRVCTPDVVPARASLDGRYSQLLRVLEVPVDKETYGAFYDWGYWDGTAWAGISGLPKGYWVWVAPRWYIWGARGEKAETLRPEPDPWSPQQAVGAPDTATAGDLPTAWASKDPNHGDEWLRVEFERPVEIAWIRIRESFNPGAVIRVTATAGGEEQVLWEGKDLTLDPPADLVVRATRKVRAAIVTIYLDTRLVSGWNEIDAVRITGSDDSVQYARRATASSSYAWR